VILTLIHLRPHLIILSSLAEQLNSELCHFILELVQNGDDLKYNADAIPSLKFQLHGRELLVISNETGFTERDIEAICSVGSSTKIGIADTTGEKGIGFKSLFKAVDEVTISSNGYHFHFSARRRCGMMVPEWKELPKQYQQPQYDDKTLILLTFASTQKLAKVKEELLKFDAKLLLFLRRLRIIEIDIEGRVTKVKRSDEGTPGKQITKLVGYGHSASETRYAVVSLSKAVTVLDTARLNYKESTVTLAFPLSGAEQSCYAYNCLPICPTGFPFLLQADFILSASREGLNESHAQWNAMLFSALADCFLLAVKRFNADETMKYTWLKYLPMSPLSSHFYTISQLIKKVLQKEKVLLTQSGTLCQASGAYYHKSEWLDEQRLPLLDHSSLNLPAMSTRYASLSYDKLEWLGGSVPWASHDLQRFRELLNIDNGKVFQNQSLRRLAVFARALVSYEPSDLHDLRVIKVSDGRWIALNGNRVFFPKNAGLEVQAFNMPPGLPTVDVVASEILLGSQDIKRLYEKIGVQNGTVREVCVMIEDAHQKPVPPARDRAILVQHARYLFRADRAKERAESPSFKSLWMYSEDGSVIRSQHIYQPRGLIEKSTLPCLSGDAPKVSMMHSGYLHDLLTPEIKPFSEWLGSTCQALTSIRICSFTGEGKPGSTLSAEFAHVVAKKQPQLFLDVISSAWKENFNGFYYVPVCVKKLGGEKARWSSGTEHILLSDTFLPSKAIRKLAPPGIPYLTISKPEDPKWQILTHLGVTTEGRAENLEFWLSCLRALLKSKPERETMTNIYQSLQSLSDPKPIT
jgi:hypothetical protein